MPFEPASPATLSARHAAVSFGLISWTLLACGDDTSVGADAGADPDGATVDAMGDGDAELSDAPIPTDPLLIPTPAGFVQGTENDEGLRVFLGVPYAAPPVGDARFRPPGAPLPFAGGTFEASEFGAVCPQRERENPISPPGDVTGDEDCLTLNVWAQPSGGEARPVMVFIHGGGFQLGASSDDTYEGTSLATAGDIVLVTINYRLGTLGLLATEGLAAESGNDSAGNYAILDQIAALNWVQTNIAAFGGDPANVTIFGESAGGVSVCALLGSPLADGLFSRAIIQSGGGCYNFPALRRPRIGTQSAISRGAEIVEAAGCGDAADVVACMRNAPVADLVAAGETGMPTSVGLAEFRPNLDGVVLTEDPFDLFRRGERDLALMIGSNQDEATIFTLGTPVPNEAAYQTIARTALGTRLGDELLALYPASAYPTPKAAYNAAFGELSFVCPGYAMVQAAADGPESVYSYYFTREITGAAGFLGAFHGFELAFVFGNFGAAPQGPDDQALSTNLQAAWTSFARNGAPTTTPSWPAYTSAAPAFLVANEPLTVVDELVAGRCALLQELGLIPNAD
ncbi:MAG: carboxylesterase family protein [Myxococcota bacterium]